MSVEQIKNKNIVVCSVMNNGTGSEFHVFNDAGDVIVVIDEDKMPDGFEGYDYWQDVPAKKKCIIEKIPLDKLLECWFANNGKA